MTHSPKTDTLILTGAGILFALLTLLVGFYHEPWADEAQAWLIAREGGFWDILATYARQEGQPPLWHILLRSLILLGFPYRCFFLIPWVFGVAGVAVFLKKAPFPVWFRVCVPFTYFIFFQYTIVARQYCTALLFLSLLAALYPQRLTHPIRYGVVLGLFAFSSTPGALIAGSLYFLFLCDLLSGRERRRTAYGIAAALFACFVALAWVVFPDLTNPFIDGKYDHISPFEKLLSDMPRIVALPFFSSDDDVLSVGNIFWYVGTVLFVLLWFRDDRKKLLPIAILFGPLLLFFAMVHFAVWHLGYVFLLLLFCLWIFYQQKRFASFKRNPFLWIWAALFVVQIGWSGFLAVFDIRKPYAQGQQMAAYIRPYLSSKPVIIGTSFWSCVIAPYFPDKLFANYDHHFWSFTAQTKQYDLPSFSESDKSPDIILYHPYHTDCFGAKDEEEFIESLDKTQYVAKTFSSYVAKKNGDEYIPTIIYIKKSLISAKENK